MKQPDNNAIPFTRPQITQRSRDKKKLAGLVKVEGWVKLANKSKAMECLSKLRV